VQYSFQVQNIRIKTLSARWHARGIDLLIITVILLSFFHYSELYYPWLNADAAVNILMAESFSLPHDLYFWGQDRGGSLVPLLGHLFYSKLGIGLVLAVSLAHYLVLLAGFLALRTMLRNDISRFVLALLWFLPPWHQHYFLAYNFLALQTSLTAVTAYLTNKSLQADSDKNSIIFISLAGLCIILLGWVSDLAFLSLLLLPALSLFSSKSMIQHRKQWLILAGFTLLAFLLLRFAKSFATPTPAYTAQIMAGWEGIISNISILFNSIFDIILFNSETTAESIHLWLLLTGIPFLIFFRGRHGTGGSAGNHRHFILFFVLNAATLLLFLLSSQWIYLNGAGRWYFVPVYYSLLISLLLYLDPVVHLMGSIRKTILITIAVSASVSGLYPMYFPRRLPAKIQTVSELKSLGEAGFIGDYWNAYVIACINPGHIVATPHDQAFIRQNDFPGRVLSKPAIYLVKDQWLEEFPDSIVQFGKQLYKRGEEFRLGDCSLCKYSHKD
jgi:hypothetical protein